MLQSYIANLEEKLNAHSEQEAANTAIIVDLQREITRSKDSTLRCDAHISGLELRLANSEANSSSLTIEIEKLGKEAEQKASAYHNLLPHIGTLNTSKDTKKLLEELDHRDSRIAELEGLRDIGHETPPKQKARTIGASEQIKQELCAHLVNRNPSNPTLPMAHNASFENAKEVMYPSGSAGLSREDLTPPESPQLQPMSNLPKTDEVVELQAALEALTTRCTEYESRCHQANSKVADLATQLSEAQLIRAELNDVLPGSAGISSPTRGDEASEDGSTLETPQASSSSSSPTKSNGFLRRGLLASLSSESTDAIKGRDFHVGRGSGEPQRIW